MSTVNEKILDKVRKLLALSESSNVQEAQAALAKANKLMNDHNLTMSEVEVREAEYLRSDWMDFLTSVMQEWEVMIGCSVGELFNCRTITSPGVRGGRKPRISYFGSKLDTEVASFTFDQLRNRIQAMAYTETGKYTAEFKIKYGDSPRYGSGAVHPKTWRTSWINGVARGIKMQINEMIAERNRATANPGYAIVVAKDARLEEELNIAMPRRNVINHTMSTPGNYSANRSGTHVGLEMDILKGVTGSADRPNQLYSK